MRTKIENSPTKRRILDSAQAIMLTRGYAGTSVDEVCLRAKVSKGNFFYYFKSKEELGRELIERFGSTMQKGICCIADDAGKDPLKRIYAVIDFMSKSSGHPDFKGCLIGTFSQEADAIGPKLRSMCGGAFENSAEVFRRDFEAARRKYAPGMPLDAKKLADYFVATVQGSFILMKAKGGDRKIVRSNLKLMKAYLKAIFTG